MYYMKKKITIHKVVFLFFLVLIFSLISPNIFRKTGKNVQANINQISNRYYEDKFEIVVPALPTEYIDLSCSLEDSEVEIDNGKIIIKGLVPDQLYNDVHITFRDNLGRDYELKFNNVITSPPEKPDNKFVYDAYKNGLGRKPDHIGFKHWYNELSTRELTSINFIMSMLTSEEFNSIYNTVEEKIAALYRTIVGRDPDEDGLIFWMDEFEIEKIKDNELSDIDIILNLSKRMVMEKEFRELVERTGFKYM